MATTSQQLNSLSPAYEPEFPFFDENILTLNWYSDRLLKTVRDRPLRSLLSLGIGYETVTKKLVGAVAAGDLLRYSIVEGSDAIISDFLPKVPAGLAVDVTHALFEEYTPKERFDGIEMGFVLEHVDNPEQIVRRYREYLNPGGVLFIAVPNARSLHRLIGHAAGLLPDLHVLSDADRRLGHKRYFDSDLLNALIAECGLRIVRSEGILLKPVTTGQLQSLKMDSRIWSALCAVGADLPDISNSLYVEAVV